jgi:hypothetical protein
VGRRPSAGKDNLIKAVYRRHPRDLLLQPGNPRRLQGEGFFAKDRELRRIHERIVQGYYDADYEPVFVSPGSAAVRLDFLCANLRLPKPSREA